MHSLAVLCVHRGCIVGNDAQRRGTAGWLPIAPMLLVVLFLIHRLFFPQLCIAKLPGAYFTTDQDREQSKRALRGFEG